MDELSKRTEITRFYEDQKTVFEGSSCQLSPREAGVFGRNLYVTSILNDVSFYSLYAVLDNEAVFNRYYEAQEEAKNQEPVSEDFSKFLAASLFKSCQILLDSFQAQSIEGEASEGESNKEEL